MKNEPVIYDPPVEKKIQPVARPLPFGVETAHACPVCSGKLRLTPGHALSTEGFTLYCPHEDCPAQDVSRWGKTEKDALKTLNDHFKHVGDDLQ